MRKQVYIIPVAAIVLTLLVAGCGAIKTVSPMPTEAGSAKAASYKWAQLLRRDSILPIYDPEFAPADKAGYDDDELVMGIAIEGEAKAYPVSVLNGREMVNDELAGTPVLVTW